MNTRYPAGTATKQFFSLLEKDFFLYCINKKVNIFGNILPNTEAAFEWCSTKVVVLQKRCETMQLLHTCGQKLRKKFVIALISSKVASL